MTCSLVMLVYATLRIPKGRSVAMKKGVSVVLAFALLSLWLASGALAHGNHDHEGTTTTVAEETTAVDTLAPSGGSDILLPTAAALLLGAGVLSYAVLRRTAS